MIKNLRSRLSQPSLVLAPGVYDALTSLLAEKAGAEAIYLSGASIAYTRLGRPDVGLVSVSEVAETVALIRDRVEIPLIVDADNGYGNALNVQRTVRTFERAGASAIQLEDQSYPKRCGHLTGKVLISAEEMAGKIKAAVDARDSNETVIIARTDAIAVEGFEAAIERAELYVELGADVIFVEAPEDVSQMMRITETFSKRVPILANMVEGGRTPVLSTSELEAIGFSIAIFPGGTVRALAHTMKDYFRSLISNGTTKPFAGRMLDFTGINDLIETPELLHHAQSFDAEAIRSLVKRQEVDEVTR